MVFDNYIMGSRTIRKMVGITILFFLVADEVSAVTEIDSCTTISEPGTYVLVNSIINSVASTCISITASDVILEGANYTLDGHRPMKTLTTGVNVGNYQKNVTVKNIVVTNWTQGIIISSYANNGKIENNIAKLNDQGIIIGGNNNILSGNTANLNQAGIVLSGNSNILSGNIADLNYQGIVLMSYENTSSNNTLTNNTMNNNSQNFGLNGYHYDANFENSIDVSNTVDGKPIYYIKNGLNTVYDYSFNIGAFYCIGCNNVTVIDLNLTKNGNGVYLQKTNNSKIENLNIGNICYGITLRKSSNNIIMNNNVSSDHVRICYGIFLDNSNNNSIVNNNVSIDLIGILLQSNSDGNTLNGNCCRTISLSNSSNNIIINNIAELNDWGIIIGGNNNILSGNTLRSNSNGIRFITSDSNIFFNNLLNNSNNFFISASINTWNISKTSGMNIIGDSNLGGNFWANPSGSGFSQTCADADMDGICDSPYVLDANNIDYLPLAALPAIRFINGTVIDSVNKTGIPNVRVITNTTLTTTTNATGFYSFAVTEGTYNLTATFDITYYTNTTTVSTIGKAVAVQDIELLKKPTGNISGSIKCV